MAQSQRFAGLNAGQIRRQSRAPTWVWDLIMHGRRLDISLAAPPLWFGIFRDSSITRVGSLEQTPLHLAAMSLFLLVEKQMESSYYGMM
jgi:hypothetical protein